MKKLLLICLLPLLVGAWEDAPPGVVAGRVTFRGKPVPGAAVTVRQEGRQWTAASDEAGRFEVAGVPEGAVEVEARLFGFELTRRTASGAERGRVEIALTMPAYAAASAQAGTAGESAGEQWETQINGFQSQAMAASVDVGDASESYLVQGSLSRGLQEAGRPGFFEFGFAAPMMAGMLGPGGLAGGPFGPEGAQAGPGAGAMGGPVAGAAAGPMTLGGGPAGAAGGADRGWVEEG